MDAIIQKQNLPKSTLLLGMGLLILLGSAFVPAKWFGVEEKVSKEKIDFSQFKSLKETAPDVNSDGVLTWKEVIASTKEGAAFIEEAKKTGPDPEIQKALSDPNNVTASFSKNLFLTSTYLKNNNITDPEAQQNAVSGIMSDVLSKTVSKKYIYGDIKVTATDDKASIKKYGNEIAKIIDNMITKNDIQENISGMTSYLETADEAELLPITEDAKRIDKIIKDLLSMKVPPSASAYHLLLLNQVTEYGDLLTNLSTASSDPMRAAAVIQKYPDTILTTLLVYKKLSAYFSLKNIVFSSQEPGYVFTVGFTLK